MINTKNISFIIFTLNEEKRIGLVVRNLIKYGEVLIMDGGSTDKTKEISENLGANFILRPNFGEKYSENQDMYNFIKNHVKTDWIYWGFADHALPKPLLEKMKEISNQDKIKYVYLPIHTFLWGEVKYPVIKGSYPIFYMKNSVDFSHNKIHGMGQFVGKKEDILKLPDKKKFAIRHYSLYNQHKFILNHLNYAEIEATQKFEEGQKFSTLKLIAAMIRYFIMFYRFGFKKHTPNLITSLTYSFFRLMTYTRLYELENDITLDNIEEKYRIDKEKLIKDFE
jgi:glycosyltransferase involved in cell wall biosynthesis